MTHKVAEIAKLNLSENARKLGVDRATLDRIINGKSFLKAKHVRKLADILSVNIEDILEFEENK